MASQATTCEVVSFVYTAGQPPQGNIRELSICTTDGFCDGKISNVASLPQPLSSPLHVVELGGPTEDQFDGCPHE